jgi:hypothetical protein
MYPATNATSSGAQYFTFLPELAVEAGTGSAAYWNPFTETVAVSPASTGIGPKIVNVTYTNPPGVSWFSPQNHPATGIGWDESTGIMTFYVSVG